MMRIGPRGSVGCIRAPVRAALQGRDFWYKWTPVWRSTPCRILRVGGFARDQPRPGREADSGRGGASVGGATADVRGRRRGPRRREGCRDAPRAGLRRAVVNV